MVVCNECGRFFSRNSNMLRHKMTVHQKMEKEEELKSEDGDTNDEDTTSEASTDEDSEAEKSDVEVKDRAEGDDDDDEVEEGEEEDADKYNLWSYLKNCAVGDDDLKAHAEELKERLIDGELSDEEVTQQAMRVVRPDILKHIYDHYLNFLKIWHFAKEDKYHKQVMRTKRRLMDEEDFEPVEAIEQAVKKRKFLIQKATEMLDDIPLEVKVPPPRLDESEEEEEEGA